MSNPNVSALTAYAGKFEKQILGKLYSELKLAADGIRVIPGVKNKTIMHRLAIGRGLKPYTGTYASAANQIRYADRTLEVERVQRDLTIDPERYRTTYLSENISVSSGANSNLPAQVPFAAFMWDQYAKENAEEVVLAMYHGRGKAAFPLYVGANTYTVGALVSFVLTIDGKSETNYFMCKANASANETPASHPAKWENVNYLALAKGYRGVIADAISVEGFNQIANTGAITSSDAYGQFTSVWRLQKEQVKASGANIYCSYTNYEALLDDYENKVKKNFEESQSLVYLAKTDRKCVIKPVSWLAGSNRLICTPNNNLVMGTDQLSDLNSLTTIPRHYDFETSLSFLIGFQIADLDYLTINDQV